jgi:cyanophycin synthetase
MLWMATNQVTLENRKILFDEISNGLINPILSQMPPGKSRIHVLKEAFKKKIPFFHLGDGVYQFGWGSKSRKMDRSTIDSDSAMGSKLSQNKIFTANILKMAGLPAPIHGVANNKEEALNIVKQITYPVVIKPIDLDRGEGVSVNISNENDLIKAFEIAYKLSKRKQVIIEKQVAGICHRLFIINKKLLYAVKRLPISVLCDGESKIEDLIKKANQKEFLKTPWDYTKQYFPNDELAIKTLEELSYTLDSIPSKDILIPLRDIESTQWGGIDEDVTNIVHPDNLKIALQATNLFELQVAGIDIITTDISKPWYETDAIINEVNFAPLLGGGDISRKKIGEFLDLLLKGDGKIPIESYNDELKALNRQKELILEGTKAYFISNEKVFDHENSLLVFKNYTLSQKLKALLLNKNVDLIIIFSLNDVEVMFNG